MRGAYCIHMTTNRPPRSLIEQTRAELGARCEIDSRKLELLAADAFYRRVDANTLHETFTCSPSTGKAIRAMILEVCAKFEIYPTDLGYMLHLELA